MGNLEWKLPDVFPDLSDASIIGIDVETCDPNLMDKGPGGARGDGYLLGVSVSAGSFNNYYPLRHESGPNCDLQTVVSWLKRILSSRCPKVGANILYDLEWLRTEGIHVEGPKYDIQIAEWLLDEEKHVYNLNSLCLKYLNKTKYEVKLEEAAERMHIPKKNIKGNLWKFHAKDVAEYAIADAKDALDIWHMQKPLIHLEELDNLFYNIETPLIDLLLEMRFKGVPVDVDKADQVRIKLLKLQIMEVHKLQRLAGGEVDVWSGRDLAKHASRLKLPMVYTDKNNPSFESDWLNTQTHPFYKGVARVRSLDRGGSVFVESKILNMAKGGRVYPTFRQSKTDDGGTKSGRFASANPNAQQVPKRDKELAPLIRGLFIAEKGCLFGNADYKQQEPRMTVHYAYISGLKGAKEAFDLYHNKPDTDYHQLVADMAKLDRDTAKTMNLGLAYGMGAKKIAESLGLPISEAKLISEQYHDNVPFVKQLTDKASNLAQDRGYIKTIAGRRKRFNLWGPTKYNKGMIPKSLEEAKIEFGYPITRWFTYRAMNSLIQGSCADMMKLAMLDLFKEGFVPNITVHDELDFADLTSPDQLKRIGEVMCNTMNANGMPITVPLLVDLKIGPSWGEGASLR